MQVFQNLQQQLKKVLISGEEIMKKIKPYKNEIDIIMHQTFATFQQLLHKREESSVSSG